MLGRASALVLVMTLVAAACGDSSSDGAPAQPTEREQLATELRELEPAAGEEWDRDSAIEALTAARRLLVLGWDRDPPINMTRLVNWLDQNPGAVTDEDWERIIDDEGTALGIRAVPAAFTDHEARQRQYRRLAEDAEDAFRTLTGHGLGVDIYVALSDLPLLAGDIYAAATSHELVNLRVFFGLVRYLEFTADYEATIGEQPACLIILGTTFATEFDAQRQAAGLMHEITHCHQHRIHPFGVSGHFATQVPWMDEGYASWAGEAFIGGTEQSARWWDEYLLQRDKTTRLYEWKYEAIALYSHLAANGVDVWANFIEYFTNVRNNGGSETDRYARHVAPVGIEALGAWASGPARHPEWSAAWEAVGPGITATARPPEREALRSGEVVLLNTREAAQSLHVVDVEPPGEETYFVALAGGGAGRLRWSWGEEIALGDGFARIWRFGGDQTCPDGSPAIPVAAAAPSGAGPAPRLDVALVGPPRGSAALTAVMETLGDVCDEDAPTLLGLVGDAIPPTTTATTVASVTTTSTPAPTTTTSTSTTSTTSTTTTIPADLGACLIGAWVPEPMQLEDYITTLYRQALASPTFLGGQMQLIFTDDGAVSTVLDDIQFTYIVPTGDLVEAVFNGGSVGTWAVSGGELTVNIETVTTTVDLTVDGVPISSGPTVNPGGERVVQAACRGDTLVIDPDVTATSALWPLPTDWTRSP